eukprot:jgi/Psemu1/320345/estExt_fgenesh1_pm.C_5120011
MSFSKALRDAFTESEADSSKRGIAPCKGYPCFEPAEIYVPIENPGFPSFLNYANRGPLFVSYDKRSLKINDDRVFFLGGSMHPARATSSTWKFALDEAVENGLNMVTIYVMWSDHQPLPGREIDWTFPDWSSPLNEPCRDVDADRSCSDWNLASAIQMAANRGLFVHLRIGPYDCAEYSYGGIPEWLLVEKPNMQLRRPNREWLETMESFVKQMIDYVSDNKLWAHQGGPIIISQIENELGSGDDSGEGAEGDNNGLLHIDSRGELVDPLNEDFVLPIRRANLQDYADWCGAIAKKHAPDVTWTMCNGLSANNTIHTCNAINEGADWLENHGGTGRIQVDQPPLWTEFAEGFQDWGETPEHPNDYFWGRTASSAAKEALRWFARGGTHLNHYMFWGAYNRGRQAAGGITNLYASDAALCSSGQRHEPKYSHYRSLHRAIASVASSLVSAETALGKGKAIEVLTKDNVWVIGSEQRRFDYVVDEQDNEFDVHVSVRVFNEVTFIENDANEEVIARIPIASDSEKYKQFTLAPTSAILVVNGVLTFDSAAINPQAMSHKREFAEPHTIPELVGWSFWPEPVGARKSDPATQIGEAPIEQTKLNVGERVWSDYAWYETFLTIETNDLEDAKLYVESQRSNALLVYVDDSFVGAAEDHSHRFEGNFTLAVNIGKLSSGQHKLSILSESLGYSNLIGRFGNSGTGAKLKGISGDVLLSPGGNAKNISLVDGREWRSFPGLHGEQMMRDKPSKSMSKERMNKSRPTWASVLFQTPDFDAAFQSVFVRLVAGRGHLWLNGRDLGRYWNITQGETSKYSQEYYFLPIDYLSTGDALNEIVIFDAMGGSTTELESSTKLLVSWVGTSEAPNFKDEVNYPLACI